MNSELVSSIEAEAAWVPQLAAHLNALNLAGLSFATKRLLGTDPARVSGQFTMWARQELQGLPSLSVPLWTGLAPLGMGAPDDDSAALCEKILRGRHGDPEEAAAAASRCATAGKVAFAGSPAPAAGDASTEVVAQRKALIKAIKDYWRALGAIYEEVRSRVVTGEHSRAVRMVAKAQAALEPTLEEIAVLATVLGTPPPGPTLARDSGDPDEQVGVFEQTGKLDHTVEVATPPQTEPIVQTAGPETFVEEQAPEPARQRRQPTPLGDRDKIEARAEAFARAGQVRDEPEAPPRPVEVLSTKPVRNRVIAPILFVIVVAAVALFVIFSVLNGPNPLAGS